QALLCFFALAFVVAGFLAGYDLAWTAMLGAALLLILTRGAPKEIFAQVDGTLLLFFAALFVVTHGVAQAGITERIFYWLEPALGSDAVQQRSGSASSPWPPASWSATSRSCWSRSTGSRRWPTRISP